MCLNKFDQVANGLVPDEVTGGNEDAGHIQQAEYAPEVVYVAKIDRPRLVSGWDIPGSLARVEQINTDLHRGAVETAAPPKKIFTGQPSHSHEAGETDDLEEKFGPTNFIVDSTTEVLLERMQNIARLIGIVSLLVALPLLWMAWVLAANLAGLLMLNERRTLGLMRLRGISGELMGRALLVSVTAGGLGGGALGLIAGSVVPLFIYERGKLPMNVLFDTQQMAIFGAFLAISVGLALVVSRRLVKYATTISPLEASVRVSGSEIASASMHFGALPALALMLGAYVLTGWIFDFAISDLAAFRWFRMADRLLDFLGLPLFLYGVATLLASKRERIQNVMAPVLRPIGGVLGRFALRHIAAKPHRTVAFLLIVALMSSVSLYPIVTSRSFEDKAVRGAKVQIGTDWQMHVQRAGPGERRPVERARRGAARRAQAGDREAGGVAAAGPGRAGRDLHDRVRAADASTCLATACAACHFPARRPGEVPIDGLFRAQVGLTAPFDDIMARTQNGDMAVSPPVADFWRLEPGTPILLGLDAERRATGSNTAGILAFLPGIPPKSVSDRQGYVQARIDYLNYLFTTNAYLDHRDRQPEAEAAADPPAARHRAARRRTRRSTRATSRRPSPSATPFPPLEIHSLTQEVAKVGSDMYISLALANMRIYLVGGLILALVAILAIAMANYSEDRAHAGAAAHPRRLAGGDAALRARRCCCRRRSSASRSARRPRCWPASAWRITCGNCARSARWCSCCPTHSSSRVLTAWIALLLVVLLVGVATGFSWWVYRHTAHRSMQGSLIPASVFNRSIRMRGTELMANDNLFKNQGLGGDTSSERQQASFTRHGVAGERARRCARGTPAESIAKGSAVAIMGPSGCGKTTLLNLLGGVDRPIVGDDPGRRAGRRPR